MQSREEGTKKGPQKFTSNLHLVEAWYVKMDLYMQVGFGALSLGLQGGNQPGPDSGLHSPVLCWIHQGDFKEIKKLCYRSKTPHQVRWGKDSQNFSDFLTTSLRADFLSLTFVVTLSTPGVQRHLAAAGPHPEGSNIWWLYSNDNHLWSATRGRRFTTFFHSNTSTTL